MDGVPNGYNRNLSLFCRAGGDGIAFVVVNDGSYSFQNNTYLGYGTTSYDITCSGTCTRPNIIFQNNLHVGYKNPRDGQSPAIFYSTGLSRNPFQARDHNLYFRMRSCPSGPQERCVDPQLADLPVWHEESSLDAMNLHLQSRSPARGTGIAIPGLKTDQSRCPTSRERQQRHGRLHVSSVIYPIRCRLRGRHQPKLGVAACFLPWPPAKSPYRNV